MALSAFAGIAAQACHEYGEEQARIATDEQDTLRKECEQRVRNHDVIDVEARWVEDPLLIDGIPPRLR